MPAAILTWYETDGTTAAGLDTYTPTAGTPTAAQTTRVYNDWGGTAVADDATELRITALSRDAGGTTFTADHALAAGAYIEVPGGGLWRNGRSRADHGMDSGREGTLPLPAGSAEQLLPDD